MDIPKDDEQILSLHLSTQKKDLAPSPVYRVLASLVKPADIRASIRSFSSAGFNGPTTWAARLLTDKALVVAEFEFEARGYTRREELERGTDATPNWKVMKARARPLRNIVAYSLTDIEPLSASITFDAPCGPVEELPGFAVDVNKPQELQRSNDFVRQVREAIDWLS